MSDLRRPTTRATRASRMLHRPDSIGAGFFRACLHGLQATMALTGLDGLYVRARSLRGATILAYHSVADTADEPWVDPRYRIGARRFERQVRFLARRRRVVSLSELSEALEARRDLPPGTVVITFDDGYLSNLTTAAPILEAHGLPAAFLLPTGYVRRGQTQWIDVLYSLFQARSADRLRFPASSPGSFDLRDPRRERDAYRSASLALLEASYEERQMLLDDIDAQLKPVARPPRLTMTWDDVKALALRSPRFEIGGHSRNHLDLRTHAALAQEEIAECAAEIRAELGANPIHFSFPYGRWTPDAQKVLASSGFRSAVGSGPDYLIRGGADRFALPPLDPNVSGPRFRYITSGAHPGLSRALVGRA